MTKEYETLREALKKGPTPEAMKEASEAFKRYQVVELAKGKKRSKPTLVSLGYSKKYPTAIDVDDIADELARNPEFFEHLREIVEAEEE